MIHSHDLDTQQSLLHGGKRFLTVGPGQEQAALELTNHLWRTKSFLQHWTIQVDYNLQPHEWYLGNSPLLPSAVRDK